jgi:hypothetical protein
MLHASGFWRSTFAFSTLSYSPREEEHRIVAHGRSLLADRVLLRPCIAVLVASCVCQCTLALGCISSPNGAFPLGDPSEKRRSKRGSFAGPGYYSWRPAREDAGVATAETPKDDPSYIGSCRIFGHGGCFGEEGHCDVRRVAQDAFDLRLPRQLLPHTMTVEITKFSRAVGRSR